MKYLKDTYKIIKYNFGTLAKFEIIYKILVLLIFAPIGMSGFKLSMKLTGFSYLTIENISSYILNPVTLVLIFVRSTNIIKTSIVIIMPIIKKEIMVSSNSISIYSIY